MRITKHAVDRWAERFGKRYSMRDIHEEFGRAEKWKANKVRKLRIRVDPSRRYYVTELCIFVVEHKSIITILPRK